jgi:Ca-activated chloride channel family protein
MLNSWLHLDFAHPKLLWLIPTLVLVFAFWFYFRYKKQYASLNVSSTKMWTKYKSFRGSLLPILPVLRFFSMAFIIIALARPQSTSTDEKITSYGIDLVISMDVSSSMLAQDFKPDRLEAAKEVASNFIANRPNDRIGLVIFGGESFTQVPITTDHKIVQSQLKKIKNGLLVDGTAIGMGIGTAINRLKDSEAESKVIILMTDGVNNAGLIDPRTAAEAAIQYDVKVYTIGIGTKGEAYMPAYLLPNGTVKYDYLPVEIDEDLLTEIAQTTGGKYYRATDKKSLGNIYAEIDQLEKTEIESSQTVNVKELFYIFAAIAMLLLFTEQVLKYTLLRTFN